MARCKLGGEDEPGAASPCHCCPADSDRVSAGHRARHGTHEPLPTGVAQIVGGAIAGLGIGIVASLLGVAGGEVLIPTLIVLFGADIKLAGSLFLALSLPTMLVGFTRYSRDGSFAVLGRNRGFCARDGGLNRWRLHRWAATWRRAENCPAADARGHQQAPLDFRHP